MIDKWFVLYHICKNCKHLIYRNPIEWVHFSNNEIDPSRWCDEISMNHAEPDFRKTKIFNIFKDEIVKSYEFTENSYSKIN